MTLRADQTVIQLIPISLRAGIVATAYWILSLSLTVLSGSIGSLFGCVFACYVIDLYIKKSPMKRLRTHSLIGIAGASAVLGLLTATFMTANSQISAMFPPLDVFNVSEFIKWFSISGSLTVILRTLAHRINFGAVLEILFVATAFVITLSAHRNGMIHRPFFIGDFALTRGIDPASILMGLGSAAVVLLSALLMIENNQRRLPYHFAVLGLLCFSLLLYVRMFGLPTPQLTDDLGLTGQEQNGGNSQRENPFRDGQNDADDKEAPVAIVVFRDDYEPLNGSYYFRESAYSQFNGSLLDYTNRDDMDVDLIDHFTNDRIESQRLPGAMNDRTSVRTSIGMLLSHRTPFGLESPVAYQNTPNPNNLRFKRTYDAYSQAADFDFDYLFGRETGHEEWSDDVWREYLTLPDDPRYQELAETLITDLRPQYRDDPFAKAWAIKNYLDENGIYSLKNDHAYETDPAGSFLFGDLTGYCMHFAFSATYMFRSLGIPARVGIGYSVPAANRAGGSALLVQAIHGHAWPEIYFRDIGWVIVDPAPRQTLVDMTTDPQDSLQQLLGDMLRNDASFDDFLQSQQTSFINLQALLRTLYILIAAVLIMSYSIKYYRLLTPFKGSSSNQFRLGFRAMLDRLSAVGLHRNYGESREQFASRISSTTPSLKNLTDYHLAYALGRSEVNSIDQHSIDQQKWQSSWNSTLQEIQQNIPGWKKLIGLLNPFSWIFTK